MSNTDEKYIKRKDGVKSANPYEVGFEDLLKDNQPSKMDVARDLFSDAVAGGVQFKRSIKKSVESKLRHQQRTAAMYKDRTQSSSQQNAKFTGGEAPRTATAQQIPGLFSRSFFLALGLGLLVVVPITVSVLRSVGGDVKGAATQSGLVQTVYPAGAGDQSSETIFDTENGVASYRVSNQIGTFTITQQSVPPEFKENPLLLVERARTLDKNGTINELHTNNGPLYITQQDNDSQTAIFIYNDLLVFANTTEPVSDVSWTVFINTFE